jgi:hypothetical protein
VEGVPPLVLEHVVRDARPLSGHDLGDGASEVGPGGGAHVALDDGGLAGAAGHDQGPRAGQARPARVRGEEDEVDRLAGDGARGQQDDRPVLEERGVERGERGGSLARHPGEVRFERLGPPVERLREAHHLDARREPIARRQRGREAAVHEDGLGEAGAETERRHVVFRDRPAVGGGRGPERRPHEGRHVRVLPLLVPRLWEPELREPGHGRGADPPEPRGLASRAALAEVVEGGPVEVRLFRDGERGHFAAPAPAGSFSSQA